VRCVYGFCFFQMLLVLFGLSVFIVLFFIRVLLVLSINNISLLQKKKSNFDFANWF
jgi:hypothetical protein